MEAVGHKEAFDFVRDLMKDQIPLSESIIKQTHYLVLADKKDDQGVYRKIPVKTKDVKHEPKQLYLDSAEDGAAIGVIAVQSILFHGLHVFILNLKAFILLSMAMVVWVD